jgi:hypothetical protein
MYIERTAGKGPFERPRPRWECNLKIELHEVGWGDGLGSYGSG